MQIIYGEGSDNDQGNQCNDNTNHICMMKKSKGATIF
jgi:hypothetical protein